MSSRKANNSPGLCPVKGQNLVFVVGLALEICGESTSIISAIKIHLLHLVGNLFPHIIDDARSKPHQIGTHYALDVLCKSIFVNLMTAGEFQDLGFKYRPRAKLM
jgi:hypothetical protein